MYEHWKQNAPELREVRKGQKKTESWTFTSYRIKIDKSLEDSPGPGFQTG